jgi:tRNA pseudouridine55 synthase
MARRPDPGGLEGVLIVAKPAGPTSHDVVALVRRLSGTRRIGHGGTLDPFASGVLPLYLGGATRLVEYHLGDRKRYRATVCFAASSSTDDLDGELTPVDGPTLSSEAVNGALEAFRGPISQRPPVYSAIQVGGRRAYALAREGSPQDLPERRVTIHELELVAWNADDPARPIAILDIACSAGTYIRAIARDLGVALGSAAYLGALTRTASGSFGLEEALSLEALRTAATDGPAGLIPHLLPADSGLEALPSVRLTSTEIRDARMGRFVRPEAGLANLPADAPIRLVDHGDRIMGVGLLDGRRIAPTKMLSGINEVTPDGSADALPDPADATSPGEIERG